MLYNDDQFGSKVDCITDSLYNTSNFDEGIIPPPTYSFIVDNDGKYLVDNDGNNLTQVN